LRPLSYIWLDQLPDPRSAAASGGRRQWPPNGSINWPGSTPGLGWTMKPARHQKQQEKGSLGLVSRGVTGLLPAVHHDFA